MLKLISGKIDIPNASFSMEVQTYVLVEETLYLLPFFMNKKVLLGQAGLKQVKSGSFRANNKYDAHTCGHWTEATLQHLTPNKPVVILCKFIKAVKGGSFGNSSIKQASVWLQAIDTPQTTEISVDLPEHPDNNFHSVKMVGSFVKMGEDEVKSLNLEGSPSFKGLARNYDPMTIPAFVKTKVMNSQSYTPSVRRETVVDKNTNSITTTKIHERKRKIRRGK